MSGRARAFRDTPFQGRAGFGDASVPKCAEEMIEKKLCLALFVASLFLVPGLFPEKMSAGRGWTG